MKFFGKIIFRSFAFIGFLAVLFLSLDYVDASKSKHGKAEAYFNQSFKKFLQTERDTVQLKELTDFKWTKVCLFKTGVPDVSAVSEGQISLQLGNVYSGPVPDQRCDSFGFSAFVFSDGQYDHRMVNVDYCGIYNEEARHRNKCYDASARLRLTGTYHTGYKYYRVESDKVESSLDK